MLLMLSVFIFIFGLIIGSFLNAVIYRLSLPGFSFWKSLGGNNRSYCPHCKHQLMWLDLIPVLSFVFLKGNCRYCGQKISIQYPVVEISTALIFLLMFNFQVSSINQFPVFNFQNVFALCFMFYVSCSLIIIFVYDLKYYLIPDQILFPAIVVAFFYRLFENFNILALNSNFKFQISNFTGIGNYMLAAFIAFTFFLFIFVISKGRWMGFGDVKLVILLGLLLGLPSILVGLFLSFFFGAIIGVGLISLSKKGLESEVPFAPFLILGTFIAMLWSNQIIFWYLHLFTF